MIKCDLLVNLGLMFYFLQLAILLECISSTDTYQICQEIIEDIKRGRHNYNNGKTKIIYNMFHDEICHIQTLNKQQYKKYVEARIGLDVEVLDKLWYHDQSFTLFFSHCVIAIPILLAEDEKEVAVVLKPNLVDFSNICLEFEL